MSASRAIASIVAIVAPAIAAGLRSTLVKAATRLVAKQIQSVWRANPASSLGAETEPSRTTVSYHAPSVPRASVAIAAMVIVR